MRRRGFTEGAILAALLAENEARCRPPLDAAKSERIARSVGSVRAGRLALGVDLARVARAGGAPCLSATPSPSTWATASSSIAAGVRREKDGDLAADLMLQNGRILYADRAVLNTAEGARAWATRATAEDRPTAERMAEAVREYVLPDALTVLQEEPKKPTQADELVGMVLDTATSPPTWPSEVELFHDAAASRLRHHRDRRPPRDLAGALAGLPAVAGPPVLRAARQDARAPRRSSTPPTSWPARRCSTARAPRLHPRRRARRHRSTSTSPTSGGEAVGDRRRPAGAWSPIPPVKFRRTRGMLPLPTPEPGRPARRPAAVRQRRPPTGDWRLDLVGVARRRPAPARSVRGARGATASRGARRSRSPGSCAPCRPERGADPRPPRGTSATSMIAATNGWCLAFDNLSHLPDWLSDAYCRLATGGGFATRTLYENDEETIFDSQRPIMLNGIEEIATRGDLLDRAIVVYLPTIPEAKRRPERDLWARLRARPARHPRRAPGRRQRRPRATRRRRCSTGTPRMADFARVGDGGRAGARLGGGRPSSPPTARTGRTRTT